MINSVMDSEQAEAITEYDCLLSIQMGPLLPRIVRLFSLGAWRRLQDVKQEGKKTDESFLSVELYKGQERENRGDEDTLSRVVKFIVLTSSSVAFDLLACS